MDTHHAAQPLERYLNTGAPATSWCFRFETATNSRSATCCGRPRTTSETRFCTRPHTRPLNPATATTRVANSRAAHPLHCEVLQHRHTQPHAVNRRVPPAPRPVVSSTPDGHSPPTLDLPTVPLAHRLQNQCPRGKQLTAEAHKPACYDCSQDLMIDPVATVNVERGSADQHRARGLEALSAHPPTPLDDTPRELRTTGGEHAGALPPPSSRIIHAVHHDRYVAVSTGALGHRVRDHSPDR